MLRLAWIRLVAAAVAASLLHPLPAIAKSLRPDPVPDAWQRPHADGANTGYANVATAPAGKAARTVPSLGSFAPGAGPVIGADGTVYVGNMQGKLMAFRPDGSPAWSRQLDAGQQILASPVIGSDGGIYVVSQSMFTDTRVNPPFTRPDSTLHKFLPGGGYAWQVQFPENGSKLPVPNGRGGTSAAPNIWRFSGEEAVIVPVVYPNRLTSGREVRLIAFSTTGPSVIGDAPVSTFVPRVTGTGPGCKDKVFCLFPIPGFQGGALPNQGGALPNDQDLGAHLPSDIRLPMPPVAIYTFPGGGTPWIVVSDNLWDVVGFSFSPQQGFFEGFRAHDENWKLTGTPMVMPNTETFVMKVGGVLDWRGGAIKYRSVIEAYAAAGPSRTAEDKILFLASRAIGERQGNAVVNEQPLPGQTMVAPAVSQNNVFVSTANAFVTFDSSTLQQVAKLDWRGGGTSPPAIGPYGDVYAIAGSTLHVFAAPVCDYCASQPTFPVAGAPPLAPVELVAPTTPTAGQSRFENPQGPNGLRLHACTEVGGDHCGKPVAKAFCQAQGWAEVDKYDTKSKKVQAETLTGETCNKNKCKVFDFISCEN